MRLSQKKNCNMCRASWYESHPFQPKCTLNFKVTGENFEGIPQEPCYKPMTNQKWSEAMKLKNN